jgi:hypothetical protein
MEVLMYYDYEPNLGAFFITFLFTIGLVVFYLYCLWRIFVKAGKPGWAALVPGHNTVTMFEILGRPGWWFFLLLIPFVNFVIMIMMIFELAKVYGKSTGFGFGLLILSFVFIPILALDSSEYEGPIEH